VDRGKKLVGRPEVKTVGLIGSPDGGGGFAIAVAIDG